MADTGWLSPATMVSEVVGAGQDWVSVDEAKIQDNIYVESPIKKSKNSDGLKATNFSVNIPSGSTIDGIEFELDCWNTNIYDNELRVLKAGSPVGTDKASAVNWVSSDQDNYRSYGGPSDKWGVTWTEAEVENIDFGFRLIAHNEGFITQTARVDHMRCKIYYTAGDSVSNSVEVGAVEWNVIYDDPTLNTVEIGAIEWNVVYDSPISNSVEVGAIEWNVAYNDPTLNSVEVGAIEWNVDYFDPVVNTVEIGAIEWNVDYIDPTLNTVEIGAIEWNVDYIDPIINSVEIGAIEWNIVYSEDNTVEIGAIEWNITYGESEQYTTNTISRATLYHQHGRH